MPSNFNSTPQSIVIKDNLVEHVKISDMYELSFWLDKVSFQIAVNILQEKNNLQFICQNLGHEFIKKLMTYLNKKDIQENLDYPNHFSMVWELKHLQNNQSTYQISMMETTFEEAQSFRKSKVKKLDEFYGDMFKGVIKEINKKNAVGILNTLNLFKSKNSSDKNKSYWKNEDNLKDLASKLSKIDNDFQVEKIISNLEKFNKNLFFKKLLIVSRKTDLIESIAKNHGLSFKSCSLDEIEEMIPHLISLKNLNLFKKAALEINNSYKDEFFHKTIAYSNNTNYLEKLFKNYNQEISHCYTLSCNGNQEWLNPESKNNKNYWKNMTNFSKLLWLEKKDFGLKAMDYKYLDYWILKVKNKEDFFSYLNTGKAKNKENILIAKVENLLEKNKDNSQWKEVLTSSSLGENSNKSYHQVISNFLMAYKLDFSLPEKLYNTKTKSIKI